MGEVLRPFCPHCNCHDVTKFSRGDSPEPTTARVARDNDRSSVGCELSEEYIRIMKKWMNVHQTELDSGTTVATYQFEKVE